MFDAGDVDGSLKILKELAAEGVPQAQFTLGNLYLQPPGGGTPDPAAALECYLAAAAADIPPAFSMLGKMYYWGSGVEKSVEKAMDYYVEGMKRDDLDSTILFAELAASGELGEQRHFLAIPAYWAAAEHGSAFAQLKLGLYYANGEEVERDLKRAAELYQAAAEQGNEFAAYNLGAMYQEGNEALPRDFAQAIRWYQVAADAGLIEGQHKLAQCHAHPDNPGRDLQVAVMWFHKAAERGAKPSMEWLAWIYAGGEGVDPDLEKAAYWRDRAAAAPVNPNMVRLAHPSPGGSETGESVSPTSIVANQPADDTSEFTEEERRLLKDISNRLRATLRELSGHRPSLPAFLIGDLLAALLANSDAELRDTVIEYVLQVARDQLPINEQMLEEARRQGRH